MSARLLGVGFSCNMGTAGRKLILLKLIDACDDDGSNIYPSVSTIATAAQCSARQVQRELAGFCRVGLLSVVASGGRGPGSTTHYQLDVARLHELAAHGWAALFGAAAKGDRVSPLEGDTAAATRVTAETNKGDKLSHPTPYNPSRERDAGAREAGKRWRSLKHGYPQAIKDDLPRAEALFLAASEADQIAMVEAVPRLVAYLGGEKHSRRIRLPEFIQQRAWEIVPTAPATATATAAAGGHRQVAPFSRDFWILWHKRAARDGRRGARLWSEWATKNLPIGVDQATMPTDAEREAAWRVDVGADEWSAWARWYERRGVAMPTPIAAEQAWMPSRWPPGDAEAAA
ncbi:MAG: helix-turn-helix domain-containing protein [Rhodospirillaceae bacterium]